MLTVQLVYKYSSYDLIDLCSRRLKDQQLPTRYNGTWARFISAKRPFAANTIETSGMIAFC